jgi:hypothetical protein
MFRSATARHVKISATVRHVDQGGKKAMLCMFYNVELGVDQEEKAHGAKHGLLCASLAIHPPCAKIKRAQQRQELPLSTSLSLF